MNLADREKKMLDGLFGTGPQSAMRLLVTLGEIYGAERTIPVSSCHVGGRSYLIFGEENIEWMNDLLKEERVFRFSSQQTLVPWTLINGKKWVCPKTLYRINDGQMKSILKWVPCLWGVVSRINWETSLYMEPILLGEAQQVQLL